MHVIAGALVRGAHGADGAEARSLFQAGARVRGVPGESRHLERDEAAPGAAHHAHRARAPGLSRGPLARVARVPLLLGGVLVVQDALRVAAAAAVDADARDAVTREVRISGLVGVDRTRGVAVGQDLDHRGRPQFIRVERYAVGEPEPSGEFGTVAGLEEDLVHPGHAADGVRGAVGQRSDVHDGERVARRGSRGEARRVSAIDVA